MGYNERTEPNVRILPRKPGFRWGVFAVACLAVIVAYGLWWITH